MRVDDLKRAYQAQPFKPFTIRVADGREYRVDHPEFLAFSVHGRSVVVSTPDGFYEIIDTMMITSVHVGTGAPERPRGKEI